MKRVFNFNPGPAALPLEVLKEVQAEFLDYQGTGMSIIEMSHRSEPYETLNKQVEDDMKELMGIGDDYRVIFIQGGATMQFSLVPFNLMKEDQSADYVVTGEFAQRAYKQSQQLGKTHAAADLSAENFKRVPKVSELQMSPAQSYLHITTNNTIYGTAWREYPDFGDVTLVADMSSDFLSQPFNAEKFDLIYAGVQKNLGPSGAAAVVIKKTLLEKCNANIPEYFSYKIHAKNNSLYNTPPSFTVYVVGKVLKWLKAKGGLEAMGKINLEKANMIYGIIDKYPDFYRGHAAKDSRSMMNATFRLPSEDLEKAFVKEAEAKGMVGVKGHRSVGGMRVSMYNYMPLEGCAQLAQFMEDFCKKNK